MAPGGGQKYLLEHGPSELDTHVLIALHIQKVEGFLAAERPGPSGKTLTVPQGELQLHVDPRRLLPPVDPVGAEPVVSVSSFLSWAVLVHVEGCPVQDLL